MSQAIHFERVTVADRGGAYDGEVVSLTLDEDGVIQVGGEAPSGARVIAVDGLHVGPGWVDFGAGVGEPGHEQRETVRSLQRAAAVGGFTHVFVQPLTEPAVDDAGAVSALASRAAGHPVSLSVIGALSRGNNGEHLAEYGDLAAAGVRFVGDGLGSIGDAKLVQLAIAYADPLGLRVCLQPGERRLSAGGQVHEGPVSTALGLRGLPAIAERLGVQRELELQAYRGGRILFYAPSLATSLDTILTARREGADVLFGVSALHLLLCDEDVEGYTPHTKVLPPLRPAADRERLRQAIAEGQADLLISNHRPLTTEDVRVEFTHAEFGAATLENVYGLATAATGDGLLVADYLGRRNRLTLGLPPAHLEAGAHNELTFFQPDRTYVAPARTGASLGANPAAVGKELRGMVFGICTGGVFLQRNAEA